MQILYPNFADLASLSKPECISSAGTQFTLGAETWADSVKRHLSQTPPLCLTEQKITGRQKGGFIKGWFWRMCPRSGFRSGGTCERTLVPVFVPGEHPPKLRRPPKTTFDMTTLILVPGGCPSYPSILL